MVPLQAEAGTKPSAVAIELSGGQLGLVAGVAAVAAIALVVAGYLVREVLAASQGSPQMIEVGRAVQEGAVAYLRRQFITVAGFVVVIPFVLLLLPADTTGARVGRSVFFVLGAVFSALVGFVGMSLATRANTRTAAAAIHQGERAAMRIAFRTGGVVGMFTVGLGLLGAAVVVLAFRDTAPQVLEGFGFGAALLAMFMRVGGGIFTKAADVGADLVGKVEQGIPEDDPRNAATIADNVGDNVGDCAGMAADLFESYAVMLVAALILGVKAFGENGLVFPLLVPAVGVLTAIIGIFSVAPRAGDRNGMAAINRGFFISALVSAVGVIIVSFAYLPDSFSGFPGLENSSQSGNPRFIAITAVLIGIVLAAAIQLLTGYFTETNRRPVQDIVKASTTGPATNILSGIGVGLESAVYSALLISAAVFGAYLLGSGSTTVALFAVALAGTGLLTTVGVIIAMDTFGPVSDNAQGIAEMSGAAADGEGAAILTSLDAVGNTTKAITKGIAIATAVLAATALFGSFTDTVNAALISAGRTVEGSRTLNIAYPDALVGLIIGAAVVFLFAGLAINAVGRAAGRVVEEVRNQFRTKPGIMAGTEKPDYGAVVDICTRDSLQELITPGTLAVLAPIAVGFGLGYPPLGAYLAGAIAGGVLMAVFLSNSGGAWDNAKKFVEDGNYGGKGSDVHAATVIGDTVGDPFKDTAGPSINPLIKVMNLVSLLIAPSVVKYSVGADENKPLRIAIALVVVAVIAAVIIYSKRRSTALAVVPSVTEQRAAANPKATV
ncbi:sodium-translocating pyrophosphatase [Frankia sp. Cas3]|uniref:sodium-translocating pyrophosphatase n=2 Tax=Frankia TaxID=1854 RepID=UPI002AD3387C|nr:sodium-translocating pyrophosphatase [Frankia sp. Cas3]